MNINYIGPVLGELVIIGALTWTACFAQIQMSKMPRSFYYILVNRIRYFHQVGLLETVKLLSPFHPNYKSDYSPYNESYEWLVTNKIYGKFLIFFWATMFLILIQIIQF